jgi:serine/threonine protein kinase
MSPQVISSTKYSSKCDIWSLGVVFYYMLFAESPYGQAVTIKNIQQGMEKIAKGTF